MAKSLRSKSKVAARRIKRQDPNSIYKITAEQRIEQAAARLAARARTGKLAASATAAQGSSEDEDGDASAAAPMDAEHNEQASGSAADKPKISTSGPRDSRRATWRAARGWKARPVSKNNGRTKRRR